MDLKKKLEVVMGLPLARLGLQSFDRTLGDNQYLSSLLRVKGPQDSSTNKINGTAFSLFENGSFVSFLQFYSNAEGNEQQNFLNLSNCVQLMPVDRMPQFCEASDSEDSSISSSSDKTNTSFESASTSASSRGRKRRANASDEESVAKRIRSTTSNVVKVIPQSLLSNNCDGDSITSIYKSKIQMDMTVCKREPTTDIANENSYACNVDCQNKQKDCCQQQTCGKRDKSPPYAKTMPENRRYSLVISNLDPNSNDVDFQALMVHFFKLFESLGLQKLSFSESTSITRFCSKILISCEDKDTTDWVIRAVDGVIPPHSCEPFIKFFKLIRCSFVLPIIIPDKPLCAIFDLIEKQNSSLNTDKWSVIGRSALDSCDKSDRIVTVLCDNEVIDLYIDNESRDLITQNCHKLKYCFWQLKFNFDC
ncbi:uncharacterized protein LOC108105250 [Drosophila eugracilis]|uniref:uncharacterized protein LOC108105250 n=1 Tax=Drosophila eugracilis TaxID=29029 RepID=UPI001BDB5A15|nr:uncharacterized protein LOC108105250 [Drosophila eugracilis]